MSDEVSWGLSQNHFLALPLVGFRGKREKQDLGRPAERLLWSSVEGCCKLDAGSGQGHVEAQVQPTRRLEGQLSLGLAASLGFMLWFRNLTAETVTHPRAALWSQGSAHKKDGELSSWVPGDHCLQEEHRHAR